MTINEFFEEIGFRRDNSWVGFGNDFLLELNNESSTAKDEAHFELSDDTSKLRNQHLLYIGRILTKSNLGKAYEQPELIQIAKDEHDAVLSRYTTFNHAKLISEGIKQRLFGYSFDVTSERDSIIISIGHGIAIDEKVLKLIRNAKQQAFDEHGKSDSIKLSITNGIRQVDITPLGA